jgi:hypothetical protein
MKTEEKEVKEEASSLLWPGVRIYHADLDEATDAAESTDFVLSPTHHILADEEETISFFEELDFEEEVESDESPEPVVLLDNYHENMFDPEPVHLGKNDAKHYTRSAAPAFRGRMNLNILRVSGKQVFA